MKNPLLSFVFLGMAIYCHAQKSTKNEFSIGYFSAGEFFDSSTIKVTSFNRGKHISLNYTRLFGKNLSVGLSYTRCVFCYIPTPYPAQFEDNTILWREQKTFAANLDMGVSKWSITAKAKAGIRYNMVGYKAEHYFYFGGGGGWKEAVQGSVDYGKLGAKLGASVQHPIIWRFFGELDCEYARMFSGADRNQLLLTYRVGFKF
jgi:hypothetical protein